MLKIDSIDFIKLLAFNLTKSVGNHTVLLMNVEVIADKSDNYLTKIGETITVSYDEKDLFCGYITEINIKKKKHNTLLELKAFSFSSKNDIIKHTRVFQNREQKYDDIIKCLELDSIIPNILDSSIENKVINYPIIQYNETNYQFLKRIFTDEGVKVINDELSNTEQQLWIGTRKGRIHKLDEHNEYSIKVNSNINSISLIIKYSIDYSVGDMIEINSKTYWVEEIRIYLKNAVLYAQIDAIEDNEEKKITNKDEVSIYPITLKAKVIDNVDLDNKGRIQVEFIDNEVEDCFNENRYWFLVGSPYTTNDIGFFTIPPKDEIVLVNFYDYNFAIVSTNIRNNQNDVFQNPNELYLKNEYNKELNLKEQELNLISSENIFFRMTEKYIEIRNEQTSIKLNKDNIKLNIDGSTIKISKNDIILQTNANVKIKATGNVGIEGSNVNIKGGNIKLN